MSQVDHRNSFAGKRARTDGGRREDDWTCPSCGNVNFSFRTTCNMRDCSQSRPLDHNAKSAPKSMQAPPPFPPASGYMGSAAPSPIYGGAPYGPSYFNGSPLTPYDLPAGASGYPYGYASRLSVGSPYGPLHMSGPPPYSNGSMLGAGGMYGMPPLMDRYGMGLPMGHGAMGLPRPGTFSEDEFQKKPAAAGHHNDWICPNCGNRNFAFRDFCNMKKCNAPRPGNQGLKSENTKGSKPKMLEGSWKCEKCNNINYPFRTKCNRQNCGAERPPESNQTRGMSSNEDEQMAPRGRGSSFQGRSEPDADEHTSDTMEDETVEVTPLAVPGLRTTLHATGGDRLSDSHATRKAMELLKLRWTEPWESWRDVPRDVRDSLWDQFMGLYTCPDDERALLRRTWETALQHRMIDILSEARTTAERASGTRDRSSWAPHRPGWMQTRVWEELLHRWGTPEWDARSEAARRNCLTEKEGGITKHTGGSIPFSTHRERMERYTGKARSQLKVFRRTHTKKGMDEFIDERSRKFMDDYSAATAQSGGSSSKPVDMDAAAWMQAAGDSGRGRVYGYTPDESPGLLSTAPTCSHARSAGEDSSVQGGRIDDLVMEITKRVWDRFKSRFDEMFALMKTFAPSSSHPPAKGESGKGGADKGGSGEDID